MSYNTQVYTIILELPVEILVSLAAIMILYVHLLVSNCLVCCVLLNSGFISLYDESNHSKCDLEPKI